MPITAETGPLEEHRGTDFHAVTNDTLGVLPQLPMQMVVLAHSHNGVVNTLNTTGIVDKLPCAAPRAGAG
eukprot:9999424-Lingulodinium_polyedra.AAC.1